MIYLDTGAVICGLQDPATLPERRHRDARAMRAYLEDGANRGRFVIPAVAFAEFLAGFPAEGMAAVTAMLNAGNYPIREFNAGHAALAAAIQRAILDANPGPAGPNRLRLGDAYVKCDVMIVAMAVVERATRLIAADGHIPRIRDHITQHLPTLRVPELVMVADPPTPPPGLFDGHQP